MNLSYKSQSIILINEGDKMSKSPKVLEDIIKVDAKDIKVIGRGRNSSGSVPSENIRGFPKEIVITIAGKTAQIILETIIEKIKDEREEKKKIKDSRIANLQKKYDVLIRNIEKEEAKENYNQERINVWYEKIDEIEKEFKDMEDNAEGFLKGLRKKSNGK